MVLCGALQGDLPEDRSGKHHNCHRNTTPRNATDELKLLSDGNKKKFVCLSQFSLVPKTDIPQ